MGRRRRAWLVGGDGHRPGHPGYYVRWNEAGRKRSRCFERVATAREFVRGLNERIERQDALGLLPLTISEAAAVFAGVIIRLKDTTRSEMATTLGRLLAVTGDIPVSQIRGDHIDAYYRRYSALSESTLAKHHTYLKRFCRWCVSQGYAERDATLGVTVRPVGAVRTLPAFPTDAQIARLINAIDDERLKVAALIGLTTGLDRGVVASLTPENFDLKRRTIVTQRQKTRRSKPTILTVPLHQGLAAPLSRMLGSCPAQTPLWRDYRWRSWYRTAQEKAGHPWPLLRVADFRKIASRRLQDAGVPLTSVRAILGHATVSTTSRYYSPVDPEALRGIDKLILPTPGTARKKKPRKRAGARAG